MNWKSLRKLMMILILSWTASILVGCAGKANVKPPDWSIADLSESSITLPAELPALCEVVAIEGTDGQKYGTWSADCWKYLQAYEITAEGNTSIAQANADALRNTEAGYQAVVNAGKMQQELTNFYAELLKDEKSGRFIDSLLYRVFISLGLIAVVL